MGISLFKKKIVFTRGNLPTLVLRKFPPANYIISDYYPYLEKIMVLANKILRSSELLIMSALM